MRICSVYFLSLLFMLSLLAGCAGDAEQRDRDENPDGDDPLSDGDLDGLLDGDGSDGQVDGDRELPSDGDSEQSGSCDETGCEAGHWCNPTSGDCLPGCDEKEDCSQLYLCDLLRHECYFAGCVNDFDCPQQQHCLRHTGTCVDCSEDIHCEGGICDRSEHECVLSDCRDDSYEPNDDAFESAPIAPGRLGKLVICPPDEDWYSFFATAGDDLNLKVNSARELSVEIIHSDAGEAIFSDSGSGSPWTITEALAWGGEYRIRISTSGALSLDYSLELEVGGGIVSCSDDGMEENDSRSSAALIGFSNLEGLKLCPGDIDWYRFTLDTGDDLLVRLASESLSKISGALFDPNQILLAETGDGGRLEVNQAHVSGSYYLRIKADEVDTGANYSLRFEHTAGASTCTDDGLEDNDTAQEAVAISEDGETGLLLCEGDEDWFYLDLSGGDTLWVTFFADSPDAELAIMADNGSTTLAVGEVIGEYIDALLEIPVSGRYYIRISPAAQADQLEYDLYVLVESAPPCDDDIMEENDFYDEASSISPGDYEDLFICPGDDDWFVLQAWEGDRLQAEILFDHAEGDLDLYLYDPEGYLIGISDSVEDDETIAIDSLDLSGNYWILVRGYELASNYYLMWVDLDYGDVDGDVDGDLDGDADWDYDYDWDYY